MAVYANSQGVPHLGPGEWALVLRNEGDPQPYMIAFGCPCGKDRAKVGDNLRDPHYFNAYLYIAPPGQAGQDIPHPVWEWDGDWEAPTLSPSIRRHGSCNWHGYLVKGRFQETP